MSVIYALAESDGEVRYIGKANDPHVRLKHHMYCAAAGKRLPVYHWIRKLSKEEQRPNLIVLEICDEDWQSVEIRLIAKYRAAGARLLNIADGGQGNDKGCRTPQSIARDRLFIIQNEWHKGGKRVIENLMREEPALFWEIAFMLVKTMRGRRAVTLPVPRKPNWIDSLRSECERQIAVAA